MKDDVYIILNVNMIDKTNHQLDLGSASFYGIEDTTNYLVGKDMSLFAIFKNYKHIQFPIRPISTDDIKRILSES